MGLVDVLMILVGVMFFLLLIYARLIRAVLLLAAAYVSTLGSALLYQTTAFRLKAFGHGEIWFEGLMFILLFFLIFLIFFLVSRAAFKDTTLPKLGFLDYVLGGVVGIPVVFIVLTVIYHGLGVMVSGYWEPYKSFANLNSMFTGIGTAGIWRQFMGFYRYLFFPFFMRTGFPLALNLP